jgi:hypothetical protein
LAADDNGETVAHWAGKRYGEKVRDRAKEAFGALTSLGVDWGALDAKGRSALSILAKKAPLDALADVLGAQPEAAEAVAMSTGSQKTRPKTAMQTLALRGAQALSVGEKAVFVAAAKQDGEPAAKKRRTSL